MHGSCRMVDEQDQRISETIVREQARLRNFIRRRVSDLLNAEDILQDVFSELVEAYRLMEPIEQVALGCSAWRAIALRTCSERKSQRHCQTNRHSQRMARYSRSKICFRRWTA